MGVLEDILAKGRKAITERQLAKEAEDNKILAERNKVKLARKVAWLKLGFAELDSNLDMISDEALLKAIEDQVEVIKVILPKGLFGNLAGFNPVDSLIKRNTEICHINFFGYDINLVFKEKYECKFFDRMGVLHYAGFNVGLRDDWQNKIEPYAYISFR